MLKTRISSDLCGAAALKILLIVLDGGADRPISEIGFKTPFEEAYTPNMDFLASIGKCGLMYPLSPGVAPGSDVAHLCILGFDPSKYYTGRGCFEALGAFIKLSENDVAFRGNLATVDEHFNVIDRRAGRISTGEARELLKNLKKITIDDFPDVEIMIKHTVEHRCVVVLRGANISDKVSPSDPGIEGVKVQEIKPTHLSDAATRTARILNMFTEIVHEYLKDHPVNVERVNAGKPPANIILLRGASRKANIPSFSETYSLTGACICGVPLVRGVCIAVGLEAMTARGITGTVSTNLKAKADLAMKALLKYDFALVHVKGTDSASHDGDLDCKIKMIERVDEELIGRILDKLSLEDTLICVTCDHATPITVRKHTGDPVPVLVYAPKICPDRVTSFNERACMKGALGVIRGLDLLPLITNFAGRLIKHGA